MDFEHYERLIELKDGKLVVGPTLAELAVDVDLSEGFARGGARGDDAWGK